MLTMQQLEGKLLKLIYPLNVYISIPGENVPGVFKPQFEHTDFTLLHNCTASNALEEVSIKSAWEPKLVPVQVPEAPIIFMLFEHVGLNGPLGQLEQIGMPLQSLYNLRVTK